VRPNFNENFGEKVLESREQCTKPTDWKRETLETRETQYPNEYL